jgi:sensor histidine kinase YesM
LRLCDRLTFEIAASKKARQAMIPVLSVQPLVENAIKHGISRLTSKGLVRVRAVETDGMLQVEVHDNGPGFNSNGATSGLGVGLENVRQRLSLCYGPSAGLTLDSDGHGAVATLSIPSGRVVLHKCAS